MSQFTPGLARAVGGPPAPTSPVGPGGPPAQWTTCRVSGSPAFLHGLGLEDRPVRLVRWCVPSSAAVIVGRAQALRTPVTGAVVRSSGGTTVVVTPGRLVWADVVIPRGDPLWSDDVGVAPLWLGAVWAGALTSFGVPAVVYAGPFVGASLCFAGLGPGEVLVDGRKVVGISQRRTRGGALFQCAALLRWDPAIDGGPADAVGLADLLGHPVDVGDLEKAVLLGLP